LALMVLQENVALLLAGLLSGFFAAMVAVVPHVVLGGASVPLRDLTVTLGIILLVGILSSLTSVRTTLRAPLLPALRGD
jgi:putative ABC transport system permease protein